MEKVLIQPGDTSDDENSGYAGSKGDKMCGTEPLS
jgi:hypothetical protein